MADIHSSTSSEDMLSLKSHLRVPSVVSLVPSQRSIATTTSSASSKKASSGRGGAGNIRPKSEDNSLDGEPEGSKDRVRAPHGLELDPKTVAGILSNGRGGRGNIEEMRIRVGEFIPIKTTIHIIRDDSSTSSKSSGSSKRTVSSGTSNRKGTSKRPLHKPVVLSEEAKATLVARENEVLAANRQKKSDRAKPVRGQGRGGAGGLSRPKPKDGKDTKKEKKRSRIPIRISVGSPTSPTSPGTTSSDISTATESSVELLTPRESFSVSTTTLPSTRASTPRPRTVAPSHHASASTSSISNSFSPSIMSIAHSLSKTSLNSRPTSPLSDPELAALHNALDDHAALITQYAELYSRSPNTVSVTSRPCSPELGRQRTVVHAGKGEWRMATHVREERIGRRRVFIEEQGWEYFGPEVIVEKPHLPVSVPPKQGTKENHPIFGPH